MHENGRRVVVFDMLATVFVQKCSDHRLLTDYFYTYNFYVLGCTGDTDSVTI